MTSVVTRLLTLVAVVAAVVTAGGAGLAFAADKAVEEAPPPVSTATPSGPLVEGTPCTTSAAACVDLTTHTAWLFENGVITRTVPFLDGSADSPTPVGTYAVEWKNQNHHSQEFDAPMPFSVFFAPGGIAFHEGSLAVPSAGCVHLARPDAVEFFNRLDVGDQVQVRNRA